MAQPVKIQKLTSPQKQQPAVSQSIPVQFYRNYIPPAPVIKPKGQGDDVPGLDLDPVAETQPISIGGGTTNSNTTNTNTSTKNDSNMNISRSLMSGKYATSMPINKMMNPNANYAAIKLEQSKTDQKDTDSDKTNTDKKKKKKKKK